MQLRDTITRTIDGRRITVDHGTVTVIATRREWARGASPRDNAVGLRDLRNEVADRLNLDRRTASRLLAEIKYSHLFV